MTFHIALLLNVIHSEGKQCAFKSRHGVKKQMSTSIDTSCLPQSGVNSQNARKTFPRPQGSCLDLSGNGFKGFAFRGFTQNATTSMSYGA
ncbi:hypothetical protein TNCV_1964981 [Trichonephila clavipes]|nr:hypothetical protein TNCV_1964981 [Trichonephila clavipes]